MFILKTRSSYIIQVTVSEKEMSDLYNITVTALTKSSNASFLRIVIFN